jgi:hypothetical protein
MAITIYKIISVKIDSGYSDGSRLATFVLSDGASKRIVSLGGLPNHDANAKIAILARATELFAKGKSWSNDASNIESPSKTFLDNLPTLAISETAVGNISNLTEAKAVILKMVRAIYSLKEAIHD